MSETVLSDAPRVLQVHHFRYPAASGGVDRVVAHLLDGVDQRRGLLWEAGAWEDRFLSRRSEQGVAVYRKRLRSTPERSGLRSLVGEIERGWTSRQLGHLIRKERVDIVHLHTLQAYHEYFSDLAQQNACRYVVTLHGSETAAFPHRGAAQKALWAKILAEASTVVTVSADLSRLALENLPLGHTPEVIHNGIPDPKLRVSPGRQDLSSGPFALCIGALVPYKGHDQVIEAWAHVRARGAEVGLVIVGDGPWRGHLEDLIDRLALGSSVRLMGARDHLSTLDLLGQATIQIMPSRREGLGLALLEGAALERPILASDLPVFREVLEDGTSVRLFNPDDPVELADSVVELINNPELRASLGLAARKRFLEEFTLDRMVGRYFDVYEKALR